MGRRQNPSAFVDMDRLWDAVEAAVKQRTGPFVSMAKFLHQPNEESAAKYWIAQTAALLSEVPETASPSFEENHPVLTYPADVSLSFDLGTFVVSWSGNGMYKAALHLSEAPLVVEALGHARWGDAWAAAVAGKVRDIGPIVHADDGREFPWIAQNPPIPGPWTGAKTEELALRAAHAEALGPKKIARLYERMRKHS